MRKSGAWYNEEGGWRETVEEEGDMQDLSVKRKAIEKRGQVKKKQREGVNDVKEVKSVLFVEVKLIQSRQMNTNGEPMSKQLVLVEESNKINTDAEPMHKQMFTGAPSQVHVVKPDSQTSQSRGRSRMRPIPMHTTCFHRCIRVPHLEPT